jgi:hypothetical protein
VEVRLPNWPSTWETRAKTITSVTDSWTSIRMRSSVHNPLTINAVHICLKFVKITKS